MLPPSERRGETVRVLVVEDSMDHAHLLITLLKQTGAYDVTHAQDGDRAIQLLGSRSFDLVITDLNLPGTDGFDIIRHIKSKLPDLPVLATTGYTNPQWESQAFRAGANDLLNKPVELKDLQTKLREILRREESEITGPPAVLAVGARIGDVEIGCGGTLLKHAAAGRDILMLLLAVVDDASAEQARTAAEQLGARIILARNAVGDASDLQEVQGLVERITKEVKPGVAYTPSLGDDDPDRREAHRLTRLALLEVPEVYAYQTATTTLDFRPTHFEDVADQMLQKSESLLAYGDTGRKELSTRFSQATARHWGRLAGFGEVEPFEVVRGRES